MVRKTACRRVAVRTFDEPEAHPDKYPDTTAPRPGVKDALVPYVQGKPLRTTSPRLACSSRCTVAESGPAPPLESADTASEEKADRSANKERRRCSTSGKMAASKWRTKVISLR